MFSYNLSTIYNGTYRWDRCVCLYDDTQTSCFCRITRPRQRVWWRRNSGRMVCSPSLVFVWWGHRTGTDRPCPTSVLCRCTNHSPGCVTSRQYRFPVAIVLILMEVLCRRNDGLLHLTSPRQHDGASQTPGHPRYCSPLYTKVTYTECEVCCLCVVWSVYI